MTEGISEFVRKLRNVIKGLMWLWTSIMGVALIWTLAVGSGLSLGEYLFFGFILWLLPIAALRIVLYLMPGGKRKPTSSLNVAERDSSSPSPEGNRIRTNSPSQSYLKPEFIDVKARDQLGMTALMAAAHTGNHPEEITALLEAGADLNAQDVNGRTALMWAAGYNPNQGIVNALLSAGADSSARDHDGMTPLMYASRYGLNPDSITTLLKHPPPEGVDLGPASKRGLGLRALSLRAAPCLLGIARSAGSFPRPALWSLRSSRGSRNDSPSTASASGSCRF